MQNIKTRIKHKINSREAWESEQLSGQVLLNGELAFVKNAAGDVTGLKVGDGVTPFADLGYVESPALSGKQDILVGTKLEWGATPNWTPRLGQIVIWADKASVVSSYYDGDELKTLTTRIPGFKVGDGSTKNVDLPFVGDEFTAALDQHERSGMHVTDAERRSWNNKICIRDIDGSPESGVVGETLVLTRD